MAKLLQFMMLKGYISEPTVRGWENGRTNISQPAEKLLKLLYSGHINGNTGIKELIEEISSLNREEHSQRFEVEETDLGWAHAA